MPGSCFSTDPGDAATLPATILGRGCRKYSEWHLHREQSSRAERHIATGEGRNDFPDRCTQGGILTLERFLTFRDKLRISRVFIRVVLADSRLHLFAGHFGFYLPLTTPRKHQECQNQDHALNQRKIRIQGMAFVLSHHSIFFYPDPLPDIWLSGHPGFLPLGTILIAINYDGHKNAPPRTEISVVLSERNVPCSPALLEDFC